MSQYGVTRQLWVGHNFSEVVDMDKVKHANRGEPQQRQNVYNILMHSTHKRRSWWLCNASRSATNGLPWQVAFYTHFFLHENLWIVTWNSFSYGPVDKIWGFMMMSSNGNISRVTGLLCWEFTGHRWISHTKASDAELCCFLWSVPE